MDTVVDHLVYGVAELDEGVAALEDRLGVRAAYGGRHHGRGTQNALAGLGGSSYLELIAPDPQQPCPQGPLPFGVRPGMRPQLLGWATRSEEITARAERARAAGYDPGTVQDMSRQAPDGTPLHWRLTAPTPTATGFVVPFLIDWMHTQHPSTSAPAGARLVQLSAEHPDPDTMTAALHALQVDLPVYQGARPALVALLDAPNGRVELR